MDDPREARGAARPGAPPHPRRATLWAVGAALFAAAGVADLLFNQALFLVLRRPQDPWFMATATVPFWLTLAALLPFVFAMAERFPFYERPPGRTALVHLAAGTLLAVVHLVVAVVVSDVLLSSRAAEVGFLFALGRGFSNYLVVDILVYAGTLGVYYAIDYQSRWREQTEAAARLQVELARAQVQALRSQLDPHFLFNALNAISGTALRKDPERTAGLISDLSQLLRRSLRQPAAEVPLEEEMAFLEAYLSIERARMGKRLEVELDVPEGLLVHPVPSLLLQPLVENAIRHGLSPRPAGGRLAVLARARDGRLALEIRDDGVGFARAPEGGALPAEGVGLGNTRARLAELYGEEATLTLAARPEGGALVVVEIPLRAATLARLEGRRGSWRAS